MIRVDHEGDPIMRYGTYYEQELTNRRMYSGQLKNTFQDIKIERPEGWNLKDIECGYCYSPIPSNNGCTLEPTTCDFWPGQMNGKPYIYYCDQYCKDAAHDTVSFEKNYKFQFNELPPAPLVDWNDSEFEPWVERVALIIGFIIALFVVVGVVSTAFWLGNIVR